MHDREPHDPTPAEIAEACRQIRQNWSEEQRMRRVVDGRFETDPPSGPRVVKLHHELAPDDPMIELFS